MGEGPRECQLCISFQALKTNKAEGISLTLDFSAFVELKF